MLRRVALVLPALAVPLTAGCYAHTPVEPDDVTPGSTVRVHISETGAEEHSHIVGSRSGGGELQGDLLEVTPENILVQVPMAAPPEGRRGRTLHERARVSRDHIIAVEQRDLNRTRLAASVGLGGLVAGLLVWQVLGGHTGGEGAEPPPGGPAESPPLHW